MVVNVEKKLQANVLDDVNIAKTSQNSYARSGCRSVGALYSCLDPAVYVFKGYHRVRADFKATASLCMKAGWYPAYLPFNLSISFPFIALHLASHPVQKAMKGF